MYIAKNTESWGSLGIYIIKLGSDEVCSSEIGNNCLHPRERDTLFRRWCGIGEHRTYQEWMSAKWSRGKYDCEYPQKYISCAVIFLLVFVLESLLVTWSKDLHWGLQYWSYNIYISDTYQGEITQSDRRNTYPTSATVFWISKCTYHYEKKWCVSLCLHNYTTMHSWPGLLHT